MHVPNDLFPQFEAGNEAVHTVLVEAPNEKVAIAFGRGEAFNANFTAWDSVSDCIKLADNQVLSHKPSWNVVVDVTLD